MRTAARQLTGAHGATFVLRDGDLCFYADEDAISPLWKGQRFPIGECISGWAMLNRQPAVVEDIRRDARIPQAAYAPTFVRSLVMTPVGAPEPVAAIGVYWAYPRRATAAELAALVSLAEATAVALRRIGPPDTSDPATATAPVFAG